VVFETSGNIYLSVRHHALGAKTDLLFDGEMNWYYRGVREFFDEWLAVIQYGSDGNTAHLRTRIV
jgi:hypothetical protein